MSADFDFAHLERYVCGDRALRKEVLELFIVQASRIIESLHAELSDENWRDGAHALKGAARGVGAWTLGAVAEEAEGVIGDIDGKTDVRRMKVDEIRAAANAAIKIARILAAEAGAA